MHSISLLFSGEIALITDLGLIDLLLSGEQDSEYVSYSCWLNNLPGSSTRNTQAVKNINCYVNKVDEEENDVAEGAVIPEKYNNASVSFFQL